MSPELRENWPFLGTPPDLVVIKVGSNVLALPGGGLDPARMKSLCDGIAEMRKRGIQVVLVTSGAVAAGRGILGLAKRPTVIPELQAVAAIGQGALMETYAGLLRTHGLVCGQVLLTRDDMEDRRRYLNAKHALSALLGHGAIPIINENDTVTIDELKFGDNDMLSAMVAAKMDADLLLIMSNVPGLMTANPSTNPDAQLVEVVHEVTTTVERFIGSEGSSLGTGGMRSKIDAARHATGAGVPVLLTDGRNPWAIQSVLDNTFSGTFFRSQIIRKAGDARRHWILTKLPKGQVVVDDGAAKALLERRSLLAVGIRNVRGDFERGDVVAVVNLAGEQIARGIVNFDSETVMAIRGKRGNELESIVGEVSYREVLHCDNMVIVG